MKKIFSLFAWLLLAPAIALAQVSGGPGPGPGPTPQPWLFNGSQIYYPFGCVTVSVTKPGACHGVGSFSADTLWLVNPLAVTQGGTGLGTLTNHSVLLGAGTGNVNPLSVGTTGQYLKAVTGADPAWGTITSDLVTTFSAGTTGFTPSSPTSGAIVLSGTLGVPNGGSGAATFTAHGILLGEGTSAFVPTAVGATNSVLAGNSAADPTFQTLTSLNTVSNSGTGATSFTAHGVVLGEGTSALSVTTVGATNSVLAGNTAADPTYQTLTSLNTVPNGGTGAASFTAHGVLLGQGASAFAPTAVGATNSVLAGNTGADPTYQTLSSLNTVSNGGTGVVTLTGIVKGNGTSAFTAATAGSDYVAPGTATTFTAKQTFSGTSSNVAAALVNAVEPATVSATAATGTINYDVCTQSVLYYTSSAAANWTLNTRCSSGTSLNTAMSTGDVVTVTFLVTQGASPFYNNVFQVDGNTITPKCQGGTCPAAGNASGVDAYTYAIIKTGSAAFTVLESQTQFK